MNNKKKCFVIMPVSATKSCTESEWNGIYEHMIKPAVTGSRLGYNCERSKPMTGAFIKDILDGLNRAGVVIADLTDRNPNVCYELGIRHTLKKRTILIAQNIEDVPSDLQSYWVITYKKDLSGAHEFKKEVREILREMQKDPDKPDSPVADFLKNKNIDILSYEKKANLAKLGALLSELSSNITDTDMLLKQVKKARKERKEGSKVPHATAMRLTATCLQLLLNTQYVCLPQELLNKVKGTSGSVEAINGVLDLWRYYEKDVEGRLLKVLPLFKELAIELLKELSKVKLDYANDNYREPREPIILLSSREHEKFLKASE